MSSSSEAFDLKMTDTVIHIILFRINTANLHFFVVIAKNIRLFFDFESILPNNYN